MSSRHQRLLLFSRGLARPLEARLWQLLVSWASCLSSTASTVCTQRRSSFGIPIDFVATTMCLTHWRYCTGCVCQNGSILNWRLWHTECWTVWRHRIWTNLFQYLACQVVAICGRRSRCSCSCTSHSTVCQQPAVACFLSQPPLSGTLCQMVCSLQRLFQTDSCFTSHFLTL